MDIYIQYVRVGGKAGGRSCECIGVCFIEGEGLWRYRRILECMEKLDASEETLSTG